MDVGTILEGQEAVDEGLIDGVGTVSDAIDELYSMIKSRKSKYAKAKKSSDSSSRAQANNN